MARPNARTAKRNPKDLKRGFKKKPCQFCRDKTVWIDYKDLNTLRKFMSDRGKIRARRVSGNCAQHQRDVAVAIKTARELAMLPYTQRTTSDRPGGRGPGGRGRPGGGGFNSENRAPQAAAEAAGAADEADGDEVAELASVSEEGEE